MKLLYLNIFEGCRDPVRLAQIRGFVRKRAPDVLGLSELNGWTAQTLTSFRLATDFSDAVFCRTRTGYHLALLSKRKFLRTSIVTRGFWHGLIVADLPFRRGALTVSITHLDPRSEESRIKEARRICTHLAGRRAVLMGDLNSLSLKDIRNVRARFLAMKRAGLNKFGDTCLRFDVTAMFQNAGFVDAVRLFHPGLEYSVPTPISKDSAHFARLRLDYAYISKPLKPRLLRADILRTPMTQRLSDHYPLVLEIKG